MSNLSSIRPARDRERDYLPEPRLAVKIEELFSGRVHLIRRIGGSARDRVFLAGTRGGLRVVIKCWRKDRMDPELPGRLKGIAGTRFDHLPVLEAVREDAGLLCTAETWIEGGNFRQIGSKELRDRFGSPEELVAALAAPLDELRERGFVHRDIKPGNLMLSEEKIFLIDFELMRPEGERDQADEKGCGSARFLAPERWQGRPADFQSDLYSLGAVLFWILTGHEPQVLRHLPYFRICAMQRELERLAASGCDPEVIACCLSWLSAKADERYLTRPERVRVVRPL